jgi:SAM-dependent methyltransferase
LARIGLKERRRNDSLGELAAYYDKIMSRVDYERWSMITTAMAGLLPKPFVHLDAGCGTGRLLRTLERYGWKTFGVDLSSEMLRAGRKWKPKLSVAAADLRALPFHSRFDFITCLFDSINFLLDPVDLHKALKSCANALKPGGVMYFDIVTEQMVVQHYADQTWTERQGGLNTTWSGQYDEKSRIARTVVTVKNGPSCSILERMHQRDEVEDAIARSGLELVGVYDAELWRKPAKRALRIDFIVSKGNVKAHRKALRSVESSVRAYLGQRTA